ncbi:MAG: hypothetical protein ACK6D3_18130 [Planctomycetaceae bacterium]
MLRWTASRWCLGVCLVGAAGLCADDGAPPTAAEKPAAEAVELVIEGAVLTPSADGAQLELKLEPAKKEGDAPQPAPANPAPKGLQFQIQASGGQPQQQQQQTTVTRTMSVIATTGIEDAEAKQELEALADRLTKGAEKLEAEGQKEAAVKKRAAADMLRRLTQPAPARVGMFQFGAPGGQAQGSIRDVEVKVLKSLEGETGLEARIQGLKEKLAGAEQAGEKMSADLKQKLKTEIESLVQKMVGDQGKVFAFVESDVVEVGKGEPGQKVIQKPGQPQVMILSAKSPEAGGDAANRIAALEKASRMLKETGNHDAAKRLAKEAEALKQKLAGKKDKEGADMIAALEQEARQMKEAGNPEAAEKLWDKAQALKAKRGGNKSPGPDEKLVRTLRELQEQITDLRNEVRELKERAGR